MPNVLSSRNGAVRRLMTNGNLWQPRTKSDDGSLAEAARGAAERSRSREKLRHASLSSCTVGCFFKADRVVILTSFVRGGANKPGSSFDGATRTTITGTDDTRRSGLTVMP